MSAQAITYNKPQKLAKNDKADFYLKTGMLGAFRGFCGLPIEHPFDVLKTRLQANQTIPNKYKKTVQYKQLHYTSMIANWKQIYKQFGFFNGIYAGYIPNLARVCSKQFYRFPMTIYFPNLFKQILPEQTLKKYDGIHKISAGLLIACIESVIICPSERLKVHIMTKNQVSSKQLSGFFKQSKNNGGLIKYMYQGLDALLYRQITSWTSFLYLDYKVKQQFKQYRGISPNQALSNSDLIAASVVIGIGNLLMVQPLDKIKTIYQMQNNQKYLKSGFITNFKKVYRSEGVNGLYSGVRPRMVHYVINSLFTCSLLEKLEMAVANKQILN